MIIGDYQYPAIKFQPPRNINQQKVSPGIKMAFHLTENLFLRQFVPDVVSPACRLPPSTPTHSRSPSQSQSRRKSIFSKRQDSKVSQGYVATAHDEDSREKKQPSPRNCSTEGPKSTTDDEMRRRMMEEFQSSIDLMQASLGQEIAKNHDRIIQLESALKNNEQLLQFRTKEVEELRAHIDKPTLATVNAHNNSTAVPDALDGALPYITARLREVETKIWHITSSLGAYNPQQQASTLNQLSQKISRIGSAIFGDMQAKVSQAVQKTMQGLQEKNKMLTALQSRIEGLQDQHQNSKSRRSEKYSQIDLEITVHARELLVVRQLLASFAGRQFKYDNYEIKALRAKIEAIVSSVSDLEEKKVVINRYLEELEQQHAQLISISSNYKSQKPCESTMAGKIKCRKEKVAKFEDHTHSSVVEYGNPATSRSQSIDAQVSHFNIADSQDGNESFSRQSESESSRSDVQHKLLGTILFIHTPSGERAALHRFSVRQIRVGT